MITKMTVLSRRNINTISDFVIISYPMIYTRRGFAWTRGKFQARYAFRATEPTDIFVVGKRSVRYTIIPCTECKDFFLITLWRHATILQIRQLTHNITDKCYNRWEIRQLIVSEAHRYLRFVPSSVNSPCSFIPYLRDKTK